MGASAGWAGRVQSLTLVHNQSQHPLAPVSRLGGGEKGRAVSRPKLALQETCFILGLVEFQPPPDISLHITLFGTKNMFCSKTSLGRKRKEAFQLGQAHPTRILAFSIPLPTGPPLRYLCLSNVRFFFSDHTRVESVYLLGLGEGVIDEWLIKAHCCHIPGCLGHLPNNIHHSFTQPPHILAAGRGPCDTGRTL